MCARDTIFGGDDENRTKPSAISTLAHVEQAQSFDEVLSGTMEQLTTRVTVAKGDTVVMA